MKTAWLALVYLNGWFANTCEATALILKRQSLSDVKQRNIKSSGIGGDNPSYEFLIPFLCPFTGQGEINIRYNLI